MSDHNRASNFTRSFYHTTNSEYKPEWEITQTQFVKKNDQIPTYSELVADLPKFRHDVKLLKNQLVASKYGQLQQHSENQEVITQNKMDQKFRIQQKFPVKPHEFKYPEHGLNVGSPLYMTSNMDYGRLKPSQFEIPDTWYPRANQFSSQFSSGMYQNNSLNTAYPYSRTHKSLDGDL